MVAALNQIGAKSVLITGHSLGAAIAALAAYDLVRPVLRGSCCVAVKEGFPQFMFLYHALKNQHVLAM